MISIHNDTIKLRKLIKSNVIISINISENFVILSFHNDENISDGKYITRYINRATIRSRYLYFPIYNHYAFWNHQE